MSYEQRDNSGSLFRNQDKVEGSNSPDYSGTCMIGGVEHYFDGWLKTSETGRRWMSFSFKPKQRPAAPPASQQRPSQGAAGRSTKRAEPMDDFDSPPF